MSAIPELPQPGVKVIQQYTSATPVVVVPSLVPCVVGACHEIHELQDSSGNLNSDILVSGPAIATAPNDETSYTAMTSKTLILRVDGGVEQTFTMPATASLTAQQVATAINGSTPAPVGFRAYVYEDDGGAKYLELRTLASGSDETIQIVGGTLMDAPDQLGFGIGYTYYGLGSYIQDEVYLKQASFPDPRGNLDELDIDEDSIRAFVDLTTETREILQSESFLRRGSGAAAAAAYDDGDSDQTTPYVDLDDVGGSTDANLLASPSAASVNSDGNIDFSADTIDVHNKNIILQIDGGPPQTVLLVGDPVVSEDPTGLYPYSGTITITVNGQTGIVVTITTAADMDAVVSQFNADANVVALGVGDIAFKSDVAGNAFSAGTEYLGLIVGGNPASPVANSSVSVTANSTNDIFLTTSCPYLQVLQADGAGPRDEAWTQINSVLGASIASLDTTELKLESTTSGQESKIEISSLSTGIGVTSLDLTAGSYYGNPFQTRVGDYLYSAGTFRGMIIEVHSGGVSGRVKLDRAAAIPLSDPSWYIVAKNLDTVPSAQYGSTVPTPDLFIDTNGDVWIKQDFLRDTTGAPIANTAVSIYLMYNALRLDVTGQADNPALLGFDDVDDLEDALGPINQDNPLAYGLYVAMANAPGVRVYGIGVHEVSSDYPEGTVVGYSSALDFLESQEVYAIATMSSELDVATVLQTHVDAMSEPDQKLERIGIFHLGTPTRAVDDILVSGNDGDYLSGGPPDFDTKMPTLSQALLAEGIDPGSITVSDGVFLDLAADSYNWNITGSITDGSKVAINTTFATDENDDSFYATGTFPTDLVSASFSVKIRGAVLTTKDQEVTTVYNRGQSFADRRMWMMQLNQLRASIEGTEQLIDGYFMNAAKAGMVAGLNPALPMTNRPIAVFTGVTGTNDRYTTSQLNQMAAGGADLIIQISDGAALQSRMQVTTKMTSIAEREQSCVKAVDYCAKFYRMGLRAYIGSYNITQSFLDSLSAVIEGLSKWLVEEGKVVGGANMTNLLQDEDQPDQVLCDVSLDILYPANYIQVTLLV